MRGISRISKSWNSRLVVWKLMLTKPSKRTEPVVTVVRSNGEELVERRAFPKGDPRDPLTFDEVVGKLHSFGEPRLGMDRVSHARDLLSRVDTLENIRPLCASLGKK